jgi:F-box and WD-40 domain protein MET30
MQDSSQPKSSKCLPFPSLSLPHRTIMAEVLEHPTKRPRYSAEDRPEKNDQATSPNDDHNGGSNAGTDIIAISANTKQASQAIAPFLTKHIPEQYGPPGQSDSVKDPSTKYCYRHRPDLKCRRQADEPSMDQLQRVCGTKTFRAQELTSHVGTGNSITKRPTGHRTRLVTLLSSSS